MFLNYENLDACVVDYKNRGLDHDDALNVCSALQAKYEGEIASEEEVFELTEKLDASSMTVYMKDGVFGLCSRNLNIQMNQEVNTFIYTSRKLNLAHKTLPISEV